MGLVTRLVLPEELDKTVDMMASRLADGPAQALSLTKQLLEASVEGESMEAALNREAHTQAINLNGEDAKEAKVAFLDKRPAVFRAVSAPAI
jgi:enoyl-CoA hydratase/carnithine racemase